MPRRELVCIRCGRVVHCWAPPWMLLPVGICNNCAKQSPPTKSDWSRLKELKQQLAAGSAKKE